VTDVPDSPRHPAVTGIVLAGGRSARFGSDKLVQELEGRPLLHHAIDALLAVCTEVVVVAAPNAEPRLPTPTAERIRIVYDAEAFAWPLAGLAVGLASVTTPQALVAGGDMPRLVPAVLHRLVAAVSSSRQAVVLEVPGRVQPLPMAVDVVAARAAAAAVLARDGRSLRELLAELRATTLPAPVWLALDPAGATIADIDRPADLRS
jgi:molybdopterin-guanine dinucleotide biosynthesis protein A